MTILRRHKTILIALAVYWPAIFILTHIPVPDLARRSGMSDKTMHLLAYFVLTFLLWYAVSPYEKVNWARRKVWTLFAALTVYAAVDEFLQGLGFVNRSADVIDFAANLLGVIIALGLLSVLSFWASLLAVSSVFIFVVSDMSNLLALYPQYHLSTLFHFTAYAAFTLICIQWLQRKHAVAEKRFRWMLYSVVLPILLLWIVKLPPLLTNHSIDWIDVITAISGIASAVLVSFLLFNWTRRKPWNN